VRQGKQLLKRQSTGLFMLDGDEGLCLAEVEVQLLG
jgi:hypothetical protein